MHMETNHGDQWALDDLLIVPIDFPKRDTSNQMLKR